jgi:hypothetical protein
MRFDPLGQGQADDDAHWKRGNRGILAPDEALERYSNDPLRGNRRSR